jgi:hypothetical protein
MVAGGSRNLSEGSDRSRARGYGSGSWYYHGRGKATMSLTRSRWHSIAPTNGGWECSWGPKGLFRSARRVSQPDGGLKSGWRTRDPWRMTRGPPWCLYGKRRDSRRIAFRLLKVGAQQLSAIISAPPSPNAWVSALRRSTPSSLVAANRIAQS